jgi:hypothetical protein
MKDHQESRMKQHFMTREKASTPCGKPLARNAQFVEELLARLQVSRRFIPSLLNHFAESGSLVQKISNLKVGGLLGALTSARRRGK